MNATKNVQLSDKVKFIALCDRIISVYSDVIASDYPEAAKLVQPLYRGFGAALTAKRRVERSATEVVPVKGDEK